MFFTATSIFIVRVRRTIYFIFTVWTIWSAVAFLNLAYKHGSFSTSKFIIAATLIVCDWLLLFAINFFTTLIVNIAVSGIIIRRLNIRNSCIYNCIVISTNWTFLLQNMSWSGGIMDMFSCLFINLYIIKIIFAVSATSGSIFIIFILCSKLKNTNSYSESDLDGKFLNFLKNFDEN